jgi:hypothetical protein
VDVFDLGQSLVRDYERLARSFTRILARDIREQVEAICADGRFFRHRLRHPRRPFRDFSRAEEERDREMRRTLHRPPGAPMRRGDLAA